MVPPNPKQHRATGLVRTLVVGSATLAILLVCFSIYQYSQLRPDERAARRSPHRLPPTPVRKPSYPNAGDAPGVRVDDIVVGRQRKIRQTLFRPGSDRAWAQIEVEEWGPVEGSPDEFLLKEPEIRMLTADGHAVKATAREGILEGDMRAGRVNFERGRLMGQVLIEYDRLTAEDRKKLPEEMRQTPHPDQLVRIETNELYFDREYAKVTIPGSLHVAAVDVDFRTSDVEIHFDEEGGRVEHLRIAQGGRLELKALGDDLSLGMPGTESDVGQPFGVVAWLRRTLEEGLAAQEVPEASEVVESSTSEVAAAQVPERSPAGDGASVMRRTKDGTPVFVLGDEDGPARPEVPARYFARFEEHVEASQRIADSTQSRLQADILEIIRSVSQADRERVRAQTPASSDGQDDAPSVPERTVLLTWTGRLIVEALAPGHAKWDEKVDSRITAAGAPVRISSPEVEAECSRLVYEPAEAKTWLTGDDATPVVVRSEDEGKLTGITVFTERTEDTFHSRVEGPGTLRRAAGIPVTGTSKGDGEDAATKDTSNVTFNDHLDVYGRFVTQTTWSFTDGLRTRRKRLLDRAVFLGNVTVLEGDTSLFADALSLIFADKSREGGKGQGIDRIQGEGHVNLVQGSDQLRCREIDLVLGTDKEGRVVPLTATALGDVVATQQDRTIRARDRLIVDFERVQRPAPPFSARRAYTNAVEAGLDVTKIDWEAKRREHESQVHTEIGVRRVLGYGDVSVIDPRQGLDLSAEELDCTIAEGRDIERALVTGSDEQPASVALDTFTVTGRQIHVDVPDEWAQVPGAGRMTFQSYKDLDGRKVAKPIPVSITWTERMKYQGRENRAVFAGGVHATSASATKFDCEELFVEFDDVAQADEQTADTQDWWIFGDLFDRTRDRRDGRGRGLPRDDFGKEPAYILAKGRAVIETAEIDPATKKMVSRARLTGPKLSVNLRAAVSKMLIEGPGFLQIEDFRPATKELGAARVGSTNGGLFAIDTNAGPSKTLIGWQELMWYDFSIDQTRFEGDVQLKHFSGAELARILGRPVEGMADTTAGRSTFLQCNVLTVDFLGGDRRTQPSDERRMGGLSADRLRQFHAAGAVKLQDPTEGLALDATDVIFEKARDILIVQGAPNKPAHIVLQKSGQAPRVFTTDRFFYNLKTKEAEISKPTLRGR